MCAKSTCGPWSQLQGSRTAIKRTLEPAGDGVLPLDRRARSLDAPVPIFRAHVPGASLSVALQCLQPLGPGQPGGLVSGQDTHGQPRENREAPSRTPRSGWVRIWLLPIEMPSECGQRCHTPQGPWPAPPRKAADTTSQPRGGASQEKGDPPKQGSSHLLPGVSPPVPCGPQSLGLQSESHCTSRTHTYLPSLSRSPPSYPSLRPVPPSVLSLTALWFHAFCFFLSGSGSASMAGRW